MNRRGLLILLGASALPPLAPVASFAQDRPPAEPAPAPSATPLPPERMRRIGVLVDGPRRDPEAKARLDAFIERLGAMGWTEGRNAQLEVRWSNDSPRRLASAAADLAKLGPDLILASNADALRALRSAGVSVPVVFVGIADPVGAGFVATLERPGANITGLTQPAYGTGTRLPELLKKIAPNTMRVAVIRKSDDAPSGNLIAAIQTVAPALSMEAMGLDVDKPRDLARAIAGFSRTPNGGLIVALRDQSRRERDAVIRLAARFKLPAVYPDRSYAAAGGLASYGPDRREQYRLAAGYADRVLKGESPADMPVGSADTARIVVNARTAKALGLPISPSLRETAEVIE